VKGTTLCIAMLLGLCGCKREGGNSGGSSTSARDGLPVAKAVAGQPGFVLSPFSNKIVDVRGLPAGTRVLDPNYPKEQRRYFRLPEAPAASKAPGSR